MKEKNGFLCVQREMFNDGMILVTNEEVDEVDVGTHGSNTRIVNSGTNG